MKEKEQPSDAAKRIIEQYQNNSVLGDATFETRIINGKETVVKYKPSTGEEIHIPVTDDDNPKAN